MHKDNLVSPLIPFIEIFTIKLIFVSTQKHSFVCISYIYIYC